jgi:hypothetical protein
MYICGHTTLGPIPKNLFILKYCFTRLKNNSIFHLFLYICAISSAFKSKQCVCTHTSMVYGCWLEKVKRDFLP